MRFSPFQLFTYHSTVSLGVHSASRSKTVTFSIVRKITEEEYLVATFGAFGMFMGAYLVVVLVSCLICVRKRRVPQERSLFDVQSPPPLDHRRRPLSRYGSVSSSGSSLDSHRGSPGRGSAARRRAQQGKFCICMPTTCTL